MEVGLILIEEDRGLLGSAVEVVFVADSSIDSAEILEAECVPELFERLLRIFENEFRLGDEIVVGELKNDFVSAI